MVDLHLPTVAEMLEHGGHVGVLLADVNEHLEALGLAIDGTTTNHLDGENRTPVHRLEDVANLLLRAPTIDPRKDDAKSGARRDGRVGSHGCEVTNLRGCDVENLRDCEQTKEETVRTLGIERENGYILLHWCFVKSIFF